MPPMMSPPPLPSSSHLSISPTPVDDPFAGLSLSPNSGNPGLSPSASPSSASASHSYLQSAFIRDDWLQKELAKRVKDFTDNQPLTLHIGTWNVNAKRPDSDISDWILSPQQRADSHAYDSHNIDSEYDSPHDPDIYVIGFQEIVDLSAGNLVLEHSATRPWEDRIERTLKQRYVQLSSKSLVGLALLIYVKRKWQPYVSDLEVERIGVGVLGVGGNKGAVAIRFQLFDSTLCFVNSHLAAHQHNTQGRNSDYASIVQKLKFTDRAKLTQYGLFDHDVVFWLGDLNYRINVYDLNVLHAKIDECDWPFLLAHDQLLLEKTAGNTFHLFHEAPIAFAPTYKYTPGTAKYERREDKKKRLPAWCDRIQWRSNDSVECLTYTRAELHTSDHKPVYGLYRFNAKLLVEERREAIRQSLIQSLDEQENSAMPKILLSTTVLNYSEIVYDRPVSQSVTIENIGSGVVEWAFKNNDSSHRIHSTMIKIEPLYGLLPVNGSTTITVTLHITRANSYPLMIGNDSVEEILILGLENGRDFFVTVSGMYRKSCMGTSIEYLCNTPGPVRFTNIHTNTNTNTSVLSLPKELWRLCDSIYKQGMEEPDLFATSGVQAEVEAIIDALDTSTPLPPAVSVHSVCETLLYFLNNLSEPLLPVTIVDQYDGTNIAEFCRHTILNQLTPCHYNAFIYIIAFLRELLLHRTKNALNPVKLVMLFASALCHYTVDENDPVFGLAAGKQKPKVWIVLRQFLLSNEFP